MRGANNKDHEGDKNVDHGLGEDKTAPGKNMRDMQYGIRLDMQDKMKPETKDKD